MRKSPSESVRKNNVGFMAGLRGNYEENSFRICENDFHSHISVGVYLFRGVETNENTGCRVTEL